jgi:hypothetical protein
MTPKLQWLQNATSMPDSPKLWREALSMISVRKDQTVSSEAQAVVARCGLIVVLEIALFFGIKNDWNTEWLRRSLLVLWNFLPARTAAAFLRCWLWGVTNTNVRSQTCTKFTNFASFITFGMIFGFSIPGILDMKFWTWWNPWKSSIALILFILSVLEICMVTVQLQQELHKVAAPPKSPSSAFSAKFVDSTIMTTRFEQYLKEGPLVSGLMILFWAPGLVAIFVYFNGFINTRNGFEQENAQVRVGGAVCIHKHCAFECATQTMCSSSLESQVNQRMDYRDGAFRVLLRRRVYPCLLDSEWI